MTLGLLRARVNNNPWEGPYSNYLIRENIKVGGGIFF